MSIAGGAAGSDECNVTHGPFCSNSSTANIAMRKIAVSLADSIDLRVILSVLYIITEVMRAEKESKNQEYSQLVSNFVTEISTYSTAVNRPPRGVCEHIIK